MRQHLLTERLQPDAPARHTHARSRPECTFCAAQRATVHCKNCPDFLCSTCDQAIHSHKKHSGHERKGLAKYDMDGASDKLKGWFRYLKARETLRANCREVRLGQN